MTSFVPLIGFRPFLVKEIREWWRVRAFLVSFLVMAALATLGTFSAKIDELAGGTLAASMTDSAMSILGAKLEDWIVFTAIFSTIGLLAQERVRGTLSWTLSKPASRTAILLAKWTAAVLVLAVAAVVLPLAVTWVVATVTYGSMPSIGPLVTLGLGMLATAAFFVALTLALGTRTESQAGIAAIAFVVYAAPLVLGTFLPSAAEVWPSQMATMANAVARGSELNLGLVGAWAVSVLGLAGLGAAMLGRVDL